MKKIKEKIKGMLFIVCFIYILANPQATAFHCTSALKMCAYTVIPSLFTFIVFSQMMPEFLSDILTAKDSYQKHPWNVEIITTIIFGLTAGAVPAFSSIAAMYRNGRITKELCEDMMLLSNGCSASFIICVAGSEIGDFKTAMLLLVCNLAATIISYMIIRKRTLRNLIFYNYHKNNSTNKSFISSVSEAIRKTGILCIDMCSYIIFFRVIVGYISDLLINQGINNKYFLSFLNGVFEVTSGINLCTIIPGNEKAVLAALITAFGGISIFFQASHLFSNTDISIKKFIFAKIISSALCALFMVFAMLITPVEISAFSPTMNFAKPQKYLNANLNVTLFLLALVTISACILIFIDKNYKKHM